MNPYDRLELEKRELREMLSSLSKASVRINESLELDAVLQGALDSACSLTSARYGVIILLDDGGLVQDFLSSGMTDEEARRIRDTPDGIRIFEYMGGLSEPLRTPDVLALLRNLGLPEFSPPTDVGGALSFLAASLSHREERLGHIFVADRQGGGEFTLLDEETLVMFASQAALVIANTRHYREERQARNNLATLINTSPVGVVVFDVHTGAPVSMNREVERLLNSLRRPGQSPDRPPEGLTVRRADGSEISITALPMTDSLRVAESLRAEEVTLSVPDGRSVSVLVNSTPILAEDGAVVSFVATLQDLTPLDELERLRAGFLAMVSHELRMPLSSIKGSAATVLAGAASLERDEMVQFFRIVDRQADRIHDLIGGLLDVARIETGTLSVDPKPTALALLAEEARRAFASAGGWNEIETDLPGDLPRVMADRDRIVQALTSLLSNAARRSSNDSPIRVSAAREGAHVAISISDEGRGIPADQLPRLFRKFSPIEGEERESGIGPALGICKGIVEAHGGRIWAESDGLGARFTFTLPVSAEEALATTLDPGPGRRRPGPGSEETVRVLAVDDDLQTLRYVRDTLSEAGFRPIISVDPEEAPRLMAEHQPHLVLLEIPRTGSDGVDLMNSILETAEAPVILLSERREEEEVVRALDMGAADYVVKPFSPTELAARIRAALRGRTTSGPGASPAPYSVGDLSIDYAQRRVSVAGRPVSLTPTEYEVLRRLSTADGRVVYHDRMLSWVWGKEGEGKTRLLRNVVKKLRRKLGDDAQNPKYILTEPRVGYRMPKSDESNEEMS